MHGYLVDELLLLAVDKVEILLFGATMCQDMKQGGREHGQSGRIRGQSRYTTHAQTLKAYITNNTMNVRNADITIIP